MLITAAVAPEAATTSVVETKGIFDRAPSGT